MIDRFWRCGRRQVLLPRVPVLLICLALRLGWVGTGLSVVTKMIPALMSKLSK